MRRKALQGVANTLCHMVDGDGRYPDDTRLARLGPGLLIIDALTGGSTHNGQPITPDLELAKRMRTWLGAELGRLHIAPAELQRATVLVTYGVRRYEYEGLPLLELAFECRSEVATDERVRVAPADPPTSRERQVGAAKWAPPAV